MRQPKIGDPVIFHDAGGKPHHALVICIFEGHGGPMVNVMFVSPDENRQDAYGRQFERETSVPCKAGTTVHGYYWRWPEEEPNPVVAPVAK